VMPDQPSLNPGGILTADVVISGLGAGSAPSLGVYDIDLQYDASLFAPQQVFFGDQLNLAGAGSLGVVSLFPSAVNVFELSLNSIIELDSLQADSFLLFSVQFLALSAGSGGFGLAINDLGDSLGDALSAQVNSATVRVASPNAVPVPAALWLFGTALAGLIGFTRRAKSN